VELPGLWSLIATREAGPWRVKLAVSEYQINNNPPSLLPLYDGLGRIAAVAAAKNMPAISREAADLRKNLTLKDSRKRFVALGVAYDDDVWTGQAELSHSTVNKEIGGGHDQGYLVVGRRLQNWTPYVMAAFSKPTNPVRQSQEDWTPLGQEAVGLHQTALRVANNTTRIDQKTLSIGTRWDISDRAALKLQWDRSWINNNGYFSYNNGFFSRYAERSTLVDIDGQINLWTVSVDFIF
jgi:hypothetical protein